MHHLVDRIEDGLRIWLGPVIAVGTVSRAVLRAGQCPGGRVEPVVAALHLDDFLQHIRGRAAGHIFIHENDTAGLLQ